MSYKIENRGLIKKKRFLIPVILTLGIFGTRAALIASGDTTGPKTVPAAVAKASKKPVEAPELTAYRMQIDNYIRRKNRNVGPAERKRLIDAILKNAPRVLRHRGMRIDGQAVDPVLFVTAFIKVESTFYRRATSHSGARGYMQLMPRTFVWMAKKHGQRLSPAVLYQTGPNVYWGVSYINMLIRMMPNPRLVTLAYNAGPNNVKRGVYRPSYWRSVSASYRELKRGRPAYVRYARRQLQQAGQTQLASK